VDINEPTDLYKVLNKRARSYTGRLWYVPFAYIGIIALALDYLLKRSGLITALGTLILSSIPASAR